MSSSNDGAKGGWKTEECVKRERGARQMDDGKTGCSEDYEDHMGSEGGISYMGNGRLCPKNVANLPFGPVWVRDRKAHLLSSRTFPSIIGK